jgi:hypothetical protein
MCGMEQRIDAANSVASKGGATSKVKLRGLPYGATTSDVVNFFRGFGVVESAVQFGFNSVSRILLSSTSGPHDFSRVGQDGSGASSCDTAFLVPA